MLKTLTSLLAQLSAAADNAQITMVPAPDDGVMLIVAWEADGNRCEVTQAFAHAEAEAATDEALEAALHALAKTAWETMAATKQPTTLESATARLRQAASEAPKGAATTALALAARGALVGPNG